MKIILIEIQANSQNNLWENGNVLFNAILTRDSFQNLINRKIEMTLEKDDIFDSRQSKKFSNTLITCYRCPVKYVIPIHDMCGPF